MYSSVAAMPSLRIRQALLSFILARVPLRQHLETNIPAEFSWLPYR